MMIIAAGNIAAVVVVAVDVAEMRVVRCCHRY